jgi:hypothetical protein
VPIVTRLLLSLGVALGIAAVVLIATRYHVFIFPFIFVIGAPLWWIWKPRADSGGTKP